MHEQRIANLRRRLDVLAAKHDDPRFTAESLAADVEATERELGLLDGLRLRNAALSAEAPGLETFKATIRERKRRIREAVQLTPGRRPSPRKLMEGL